MGTYRTVSQIAVDISKYGSVGALLLHDIIIPPPRRRETSTVCLSVCPSSTRNKYFRLIFLRNYWCQTLHIWCAASASGPTPRLPNFTLVQYSPLNRFPTFKKKFLSILEMDLSFGVYWDVPVLLGSFRLSSHKKIRRSCDCSVNKKKLGLKYNF